MSDTQGRYRIGVDVGGTFTGAAVFDDAAGSLRYAKVPSTPADPARAVLDVLERLGVDFGEVQRFIHGITIGTNAVLEGRGAEVWMLTTAGFRDVLEIARTNRTVLYDITALKPPPSFRAAARWKLTNAWAGTALSCARSTSTRHAPRCRTCRPAPVALPEHRNRSHRL